MQQFSAKIPFPSLSNEEKDRLRLMYGLPVTGEFQDYSLARLVLMTSLYATADKHLVPVVNSMPVRLGRVPTSSDRAVNEQRRVLDWALSSFRI